MKINSVFFTSVWVRLCACFHLQTYHVYVYLNLILYIYMYDFRKGMILYLINKFLNNAVCYVKFQILDLSSKGIVYKSSSNVLLILMHSNSLKRFITCLHDLRIIILTEELELLQNLNLLRWTIIYSFSFIKNGQYIINSSFTVLKNILNILFLYINGCLLMTLCFLKL